MADAFRIVEVHSMRSVGFRSPPGFSPSIILLSLLAFGPSLTACGGGQGSVSGQHAATKPATGQSDFTSAPQLGVTGSSGGPRGSSASDGNLALPAAAGAGTSATTATTTAAPRSVQETDLYAVEGTRLYYLNSYRGLMVFDITNPDAPALLGRAAIFGDPQEMTVHDGVAVVVVADWYGDDDKGAPFHGSIVRGFDATDPTNIKVVGEAKLGGYVQDTRVVGNVLYAVVEDYGWQYGWYNGWGGYYGGGGIATGVAIGPGGGGGSNQPAVAIASVSFAGGVVVPVGYQKFPGTGGVFNVTAGSIMLATDVTAGATASNGNAPGQTSLQYVDISDPGGAIKLRGTITVNGAVTGWGPDNGRWNLDFADGVTAHALGCGNAYYCGSPSDQYLLSTVDFTDPDAPRLRSSLPIANLGWSAAALFDGTKLYLSPSNNYATGATTPFSVYDLSAPDAPKLAGQTELTGSIWLYRPDGTRLFSLGSSEAANSSQVEVQYLNVTDPAAPKVIGSSTFGNGWTWSPVASTFKAVTIDDSKGLMVVPFSGWDYNSSSYTNGVQLLQYTSSGITSSATALSKGWVQRGIFVNDRLFSISDEALAVVDYANPAAPKVVTQLTLARNVVNAQPQGSTIAELSSDWWGNDDTASEMRVLPIANASETTDDGTGVSASIAGVGAQVFQNGTLAYVVTNVQHPAPCDEWNSYPGSPKTACTGWSEQVQVVDTANGGAKLRGTITLPDTPNGWSGWGWGGFWYYDWFNGAEIVQVGSDALAFRRWYPQYAPQGADGSWSYVDSLDSLFVVDLSNPDAPAIASTTVTDDSTTWWGDMQAVGSTLYATHYEWVNRPDPSSPSGTLYYVKYYLDEVDLSDRAHPKVGKKISVPGQLVGASAEDPSLLYTVDYRWDSNDNPRNDLDVVKIEGDHAYLQSVTELDGWVGNVIVQGNVAYTSVQEYDWLNTPNGGVYKPPYIELHQIDLSNPQAPVDRISTNPDNGWGWLLAVQGDRAVVTSGWGPIGLDIYKLSPTAAPVFDQSVRTLGWGANSIIRQDNTLYVASGYWGVQPVTLQ